MTPDEITYLASKRLREITVELQDKLCDKVWNVPVIYSDVEKVIEYLSLPLHSNDIGKPIVALYLKDVDMDIEGIRVWFEINMLFEEPDFQELAANVVSALDGKFVLTSCVKDVVSGHDHCQIKLYHEGLGLKLEGLKVKI